MRGDWKLPNSFEAGALMLNGRKDELVLVELERPLLVLQRDNDKKRYLALQVDADANFTRWLHAPVPPLELEAIARGGHAVYKAFVGRPLTVVDCADDGETQKPIQVTTLHGHEGVPRDVLPVGDALLPSVSRAALSAHLELKEAEVARMLRLKGAGLVGETKIAFHGAALLLDAMQDVWTNLALTLPGLLGVNDARLALAGMRQTSVGFVIDVGDEALFDKIAEEHEKVVARVYDDDPEQSLASLPASVTAAYRHLTDAVTELDVELLAERKGRPPTYLGQFAAETAGEAIRTIERAPARRLRELGPQKLSGYFDMLTLKGKTFTFADSRRGEVRGSVAMDLIAKLLAGTREVRVGHKSRYFARALQTELDDGTSRWRLVDFEEQDGRG